MAGPPIPLTGGSQCWVLGEREPHRGPGLPGHPHRVWKIKLGPVGLCEERPGRPQGRRWGLEAEGQGAKTWGGHTGNLTRPLSAPFHCTLRPVPSGPAVTASLCSTLSFQPSHVPPEPHHHTPRIIHQRQPEPSFYTLPHNQLGSCPCCRIPTVPSRNENRHSWWDTLATGSGLAPFHLPQRALRAH